MNEQDIGYPKETIPQSKKYISPFESLDYSKAAEAIAYNGTLEGVIEELGKAINEPGQPDKTSIVLHPPRIIRAAINYKVAQPHSQTAHDILKKSVELGLQVYENPAQSAEDLERFKEQVTSQAPDLLTLPLTQRKDLATWEASHHRKSQRTAEELAERNDDILFISLAHGGVAAGMDTYLRYRDIKKDTHSSFYVVRLSHSSTYDKEAQITTEEKAYLLEQSKDRSVIIFDEDQATGMTLENAEATVQRIVKKPVTGIANMGAPAGYFSD